MVLDEEKAKIKIKKISEIKIISGEIIIYIVLLSNS